MSSGSLTVSLDSPRSPLAEIFDQALSLEGSLPELVLRWAAQRFPSKITLATGFGVEGCVLVDLIGRFQIPIDIFALDTGLLFPETYRLWKKLEQRYGLQIRAVQPVLSLETQAAVWGPKLWEQDPDRCCEIRKLFPLHKALSGFDAWVTGIRRDQTRDRSSAKVVEWDSRFRLVKVNPLVGWSSSDVWAHVRANGVPYNPLHDQNYPSIGCMPCTSPVFAGEDPRAGRWRGRSKTECGLHSRAVAQPHYPRLDSGEDSHDSSR